MKKRIYIYIGISIILFMNILGHFFGPLPFISSFAYMSAIVGIVNYKIYNNNFKLVSAYNYFLLLINDILIRIFASGTHDEIAKFLYSIEFHLGFLISSIIMIVFSEINYKGNQNLLYILIYSLITEMIYLILNVNI